ncbi:MAG: hypothetical protein DBX47_02265 [Clostridiales bacterium]|nr:MAG: hypothetical protein DBX47_02265 [Clostridiales bacterium]
MQQDIFEQVKEWGINLGKYSLPRWENLPLIDLYMDQVLSLLDAYLGIYSESTNGKIITSSIINNYVKLGIIPPPVKKKYSRKHIAYLLMVCLMKPVMPIAMIKLNIDLQLKLYPISDVFNQFSIMFERTTKQILLTAYREAKAYDGDAVEFLQKLSIKSAVQANASKMISEKILSMYNKPVEK